MSMGGSIQMSVKAKPPNHQVLDKLRHRISKKTTTEALRNILPAPRLPSGARAGQHEGEEGAPRP